MQLETKANHSNDTDERQRYLIFSLANELYGTPLTLVREVLKYPEIKQVPYMKNYFLGVINIRGQIISVIDLRQKFDIDIKNPQSKMLIVVEREGHLLAAVVDEVKSVATIDEDKIDRNPTLSTKIPINFFLGIGQSNERLINLIDVAGSLTIEDFSTIQRTKEEN